MQYLLIACDIFVREVSYIIASSLSTINVKFLEKVFTKDLITLEKFCREKSSKRARVNIIMTRYCSPMPYVEIQPRGSLPKTFRLLSQRLMIALLFFWVRE